MRVAIQPANRRPVFGNPRQARPKTFPAPVRGWVTNQNLSAAPEQAALVLDNWFPTQTGVRLRGGTALHATLGGAVTALWTYQSGNTEFLFAADAGNIYNVTSVADPDVAPTAEVDSLTGGDWTFVQFETSGGTFLVGVNGADTPLQFDGSAFANSTMTGSGLTPSNLSHVWPFKNRLFFIESGTMKAWYLTVGAITGTLTQFSLAGVFKKGGALLFGATWSLDSGDGPDDLCVFVSTLGEVAIYQGTDPSSASTWAIVGRYDIARPLGKEATIQAGGDLLIATEEGIVPLSEAIRKDPAALSLSAVTRAIEPDWNVAVRERGGLAWSMHKYSLRNMLVVGMPAIDASVAPLSYVANLETGAWCRFTGVPWDVRAQAELLGVHYVGGGNGKIYRTETTGSDAGDVYVCDCVMHFDHLGSMGPVKTINLARASFRATRAFNAKVSGSVNYDVRLPAAPSSVADSTEDAWDEGEWDDAVWDSSSPQLVTSRWQALSKLGFVFAPQVQVTCGVTPRPDAELMSIDVMYETGAVVV